MAVSRKTAGIKIPGIFLRNDADGTGSGQVILSKAGTVGLALTGSNPQIALSGTMGAFYLGNQANIIGTLTVGTDSHVIWSIGGSRGTFN